MIYDSPRHKHFNTTFDHLCIVLQYMIHFSEFWLEYVGIKTWGEGTFQSKNTTKQSSVHEGIGAENKRLNPITQFQLWLI